MALWQSNMDTPPLTKKDLLQQSVTAAAACHPSPLVRRGQLTYLSPGLVVSLCRRDLILALVQAGEQHIDFLYNLGYIFLLLRIY